MNHILRVSPLVFILLTASCSKLWIQPDHSPTREMASTSHSTSSAPQQEYSGKFSKTSMATATGAALGAVTGLAIGSATGAAGEGFVLGTAAGAAAGAGIGRALDGPNAHLARQREAVRQQDERIKAQGSELKKLRDSVQDGQFQIPSSNTSSLNTERGQRYAGHPSARPFSGNAANAGAGAQRAKLGSTTAKHAVRQAVDVSEITLTTSAPSRPVQRQQQVQQQQLAAQNTQMRDTPNAMPPSTSAASSTESSQGSESFQGAPAPRLIGVEGGKISGVVTPKKMPKELPQQMASASTSGLPPARGTTPREQQKETRVETPPTPQKVKVATTPKPKARAEKVQKAATTEKATAEKPAPKEERKSNEKPATKVAKKSTTNADSGCGKAESEAASGHQATSDADKLFYFRRAISLCPSEPDYYVEVGKVYVSIGRTEEAQREFNKALELDPEHDAAQNELSMIMLGAVY